ncbi:hypothetical protein MBLNU457_g2794t1 [Dothideomycetes sp. NU457]
MYSSNVLAALAVTSSLIVSEAVAAAIPSSTTTGVATRTGKRGLAYNTAALTQPFGQDADSQVSWAYNWAQGEWDPSNYNENLEFVPMLWSNASDLTSSWAGNAQYAIDNGATALLGFNEPDLCVPGSACMSLNSSLTAWKQYMEPFAGKALLGSPAVTNGGSTGTHYMGADYLNYFIGNCTGCHIDFVNMHWYSNIYAGVGYLQTQVENIRAVAGGRPIWVTEFAIDNSNPYTEAQLEAFVKAAVLYLDSQPDVHRYAYFMDAEGILMNNAGTAMSAIGELFDSYNGSAVASPSSSSLSSSSAVRTSSTVTSSSTTPALISISIGASTTSSSSSSTPTTLATTTTSSSSSTTSSAVSTSTPSITILSAFFAMKDVTNAAQKAFLKNGILTINTDSPAKVLGGNPWPGHRKKSLSILYSISGSSQTYIFTAMVNTGTYRITPDTATSTTGSAMTPSLPPAQGSSITIVGVTWGGVQVTDQGAWNKIYAIAASGSRFTMNPALFGVNPYKQKKTGTIWYMQGGVLKALSGVGGKSYSF